jgi:hypothetical protein
MIVSTYIYQSFFIIETKTKGNWTEKE